MPTDVAARLVGGCHLIALVRPRALCPEKVIQGGPKGEAQACSGFADLPISARCERPPFTPVVFAAATLYG
jgi:hypothetical protein